ncbi:MAG TPA: ABC transporter substrate-binding protein [Pseudonocardiaceae bacterium]|nr:ABC transporter substrate-binding protein [Pseudonocardiaceae bacterium]
MKIANRRTRTLLTAAVVAQAAVLVLGLSACSRANSTPAASSDQGAAAELRLGYFPNVTHAAALVGLDKGFYAKDLGKTKLTLQTFNAGPNEVNALLGGSLDAAFIGSGPAINAFSKSDGQAVRLIAGATSGGAQLVVANNINSPSDLIGKTIATPQLGNTQDVSLKTWLANNKLTGKVNVDNLANPSTLTEFQKGAIQGAWLPEPWSSQLLLAGGAKVLVDESTLWPNGQFPTTVLIVRTQYLQQHPETVQALIKGELDSINWAKSNTAGAEAAVNDQLKKLTGQALSQAVIDRAFSKITMTPDPLASDFPALATDQVTAGIVKTAPKVNGFADLTLLNNELKAEGQPTVSAGSIGGN